MNRPIYQSRSAPRTGPAQLKRSRMKRKRSVQPPHKRDNRFKAFVRTLPCCAPGKPCHRGPSDPHHKMGAGMGLTSHDRTCVPLCRIDHDFAQEFGSVDAGPFTGWTREQMTEWHDAESARVLALYLAQTSTAATAADGVF